MKRVDVESLPERFHRAMVAWQERHFKDYPYLVKHWGEFYRQEPFRLVAKIGDLESETIEVGERKGRRKLDRIGEADEETRAKSLAIIRAQASTELGSVQQHRESLHKAQDPRAQFDVLRIMAEEYRHGYQMLYLLASDDWGDGVTRDVIDGLLTMETGGHVLDAFNVYFDSFVDNVVFAALIDRVGKYQLSMQKVFAYVPMARSMGPMLREEAFHLATGVNTLKRWVGDAARDAGNVSVATIQRHINKWLPRGLEMFGDERGGETNVRLGLKDRDNATAVDQYWHECRSQVVDELNAEIVRARFGKVPKQEAIERANHVLATGERFDGLSPEELLYLPTSSFFRRRGIHAFEMRDVGGRPMASEPDFLRHLRTVLPEGYVAGKDFSTYIANLRKTRAGHAVSEQGLPFYG